MLRWLGIIFGTLRSTLRTHRELALENFALRQQVAVWKAGRRRPRLTEMDRIFWVLVSRLWKSWRHSVHIVRPETVVRWHRRGFRLYWAWKSRRRWGRPAIGRHLRDLIRQMSRANPLWGAPRIHGELLKLGLTVSQATVSKYMVRRQRPPSQGWRTFLKNHAPDLIALDFFTVPTATFRVLFVLVMLTHSRRRLVHFNVTDHPTAEWTARQLLEVCALEGPRYLLRDRDQVYGDRFSRQAKTLEIREAVIAPRSPWHNAYAERVIGSIRRECLDHVVVISERHLREILSKYVDYYNATRTHLSLAKDAPDPRSVQPPSQGRGSRFHASVGSITNINGGRREPDRTNKWKAHPARSFAPTGQSSAAPVRALSALDHDRGFHSHGHAPIRSVKARTSHPAFTHRVCQSCSSGKSVVFPSRGGRNRPRRPAASGVAPEISPSGRK